MKHISFVIFLSEHIAIVTNIQNWSQNYIDTFFIMILTDVNRHIYNALTVFSLINVALVVDVINKVALSTFLM